MNTITQNEIDNLPQPPQEWIDDIEKNRLNDVIKDVPNEIWFMIGDFKRAAEQRDYNNLQKQLSTTKDIYQQLKDKIDDEWTSEENNKYLQYDYIQNTIQKRPHNKYIIQRGFKYMINTTFSETTHFMSRFKYNWTGVSKHYFKMKPSIFIDNVLNRKTKLNTINIRFFNFIVGKLIELWNKKHFETPQHLFKNSLSTYEEERDETIMINEITKLEEKINNIEVMRTLEDI